MRKAVIILILALCLGACGTPWRCTCGNAVERIHETVDSVGTAVQDVEVPIPEESAADSVALVDTSRVQTSIAEARAWVEDGRLHQQLRNRSEELLRVKLEVPVYFHTEKEYITRTVVREVEKPSGWFRQVLEWVGAAAIAVGVAALVSAILKAKTSH